MQTISKHKRVIRTLQFMVIDAFSIGLSFGLTVLIFTYLKLPINYFGFWTILPVVILLKLAVYTLFGLYTMLLDHFGFEDAFKIFIVVVASNAALVFFFGISRIEFVDLMMFIFIAPLEMIFLAAPRILKRAVNMIRLNLEWRTALGKRTLIIGAGDGGEMVLKEIYRNKSLTNIPVGFVDDNPNKIGSRLSGIRILGPIAEIKNFIDELRIEEVIIAIANMELPKLQAMIKVLSEKSVTIKRLPLMAEIDEGTPQKIIEVHVEDLLNREEIHLDNEEIKSFIYKKVVLVTGGGGSIGSELCRQIVDLNPTKLVIFDIYENNAYDIQMEIERKFHKLKKPLNLKVLIGSVYNYERLEQVFKMYKPDIVFHAAAYKHVPLMEDSPQEAIRTNVLGTYNTAKLAHTYQVNHFVLVSSDKAVRPTNIMGATKRYAELIIQHFDEQSDHTRYSAVRFGNVLGSNGSVIPLFKKQIEDGGPVTVTHPEITRFFMTIPESVSLILQAASYAKGGEIFVLDMGEPVKIKDLAEKMIRLAGFRPYEDIDIEYSGLRPGEKLYEELLVDETDNIKTENNKIFIEDKTHNGKSKFTQDQFDAVIKNIEKLDTNELKDEIAKIIKSYTCNGNGHSSM
ncbi:MAG: polysaccharide biosynthesis protein [Candidatus Izemoplasmataceae bacterium]